MPVLPILLYARNPKRFAGLHVYIVAAGASTPLSLELHQAPSIKIQRASRLRLIDVSDPRRSVIGMATFELNVSEIFHVDPMGPIAPPPASSTAPQSPSPSIHPRNPAYSVRDSDTDMRSEDETPSH